MINEKEKQKPRLTPIADFGLSSQQCRLLVMLESVSSVVELANLMQRDPSVISRQLKQISLIAPVVEKRGGSWQLTSLGRQVNNWTRDAVLSQNKILSQGPQIRIAAAPEFASRIMAPSLTEILSTETSVQVSVLTSAEGTEKLLLSGDADLGFDYGRPSDPLIRFKSVIVQPFVVVATPQFVEKHAIGDAAKLPQLPFLQYTRYSTSTLGSPSPETSQIVATFNDIRVVKEACLTGLGWAILPQYAVQKEVDAGALVTIQGWEIPPEKFGVWWVSGRTTIKPWVEKAIAWLKDQKL